jgi:hypothetical protein
MGGLRVLIIVEAQTRDRQGVDKALSLVNPLLGAGLFQSG